MIDKTIHVHAGGFSHEVWTSVPTYRIIRFYFNGTYRSRVISRGLTLEQARAHCNDPETSSSTATSARARVRTLRQGPWFDGYTEE